MVHFAKTLALCSLFVLTGITVLRGQDTIPTTFGDGFSFYAGDTSMHLNFYPRFQSRVVARTPLSKSISREDIRTRALVRRARLKFDGYAFHPDVEFKLQVGLSNDDLDGVSEHTSNAPNAIMDAVIKWHASERFSLWWGQTKLRGSREFLISSQDLQFVDRSILDDRFRIGRDMGFQFLHHFELGPVLIRERVSISQGEGRNIVSGAHKGYAYNARLEVLPFGPFNDEGDYVGPAMFQDPEPKLALGATYGLNRNAIRTMGYDGAYLPYSRDLTRIHIDLMFKYGGFSLMGEWGQRNAGAPVIYEAETVGRRSRIGSYYTGQGWNFHMGYLFKNDFEVAARYSSLQPEQKTGYPEAEQYALALSRYIHNNDLKIQADVSYIEKNGLTDDHLRLRLQTELAL